MDQHPLESAIRQVGLARLARELEVTPPAIRKWQRNGRLPRTEWTGETRYAARIAALAPGVVTEAQLKGAWPAWNGATVTGQQAQHAGAVEQCGVGVSERDNPSEAAVTPSTGSPAEVQVGAA